MTHLWGENFIYSIVYENQIHDLQENVYFPF